MYVSSKFHEQLEFRMFSKHVMYIHATCIKCDMDDIHAVQLRYITLLWQLWYLGSYNVFTCIHAYNMQAYQARDIRVHIHQVEALDNYVYKV